ncbi:uncharacterized protein YecE (DUF72 family) [Ornithinimicrobium humiphilum]|uniref:Uncharacterized protein YecE (DUF72 family) n=1 Tax=Ornithinimicrobium humiphilum TaxID=125288 RepID=A0A543KLH1_9MICO|nr:DUF72 domain-containing protein [Ornithinimicrobium humiphilum]TQM95939.1 uncharacterized protein YecE (DUF72 family) [Ornithinimicrobium humiphilum]
MTTHEVRVGISGWRYAPWRGGAFYPRGLPQRRELEHATGLLRTIEINGSFYSLQRPSSYQAWASQAPEDFVFAVKGSRYITHMLKLRDVGTALANFVASGPLALGPKLGPVLWQLAPRLRYDAERLDDFLARLPRTHGEAAELGRGHDDRLREPAYLETAEPDRPLEHVLEVRHPTFDGNAEFLDLLRRHRVGVVVADAAGLWPYFDEVTSPVVYVRLHGDTELYTSGYSEEALQTWAERVRRWSREADVYVYFDNDAKVHAPHDALRLARILWVGPVR